MGRLNVAVIGDLDESYPPHTATNAAISHSAGALGTDVAVTWLATETLAVDLDSVASADVLWCAPGSPYRSLAGALAALRFGRENAVPTLGTCGGCQHIILEFTRNVLGFTDAQSELTCSLAGQTMPVTLRPRSIARHCTAPTGSTKTITATSG